MTLFARWAVLATLTLGFIATASATAAYDGPSGVLTMSSVRINATTAVKDVKIQLSKLGELTLDDPSVGAENAYDEAANVLTLPSVLVDATWYSKVRISQPAFNLVSFGEVVTPGQASGWTRLADLPEGVAKFGVAALGGKIYVAGGYDTRRAVMVYDIATNRWSSGPDLARGTDNVAAVAAGSAVYAMGGEARTAMQVFSPDSERWTFGPTLPRIGFASAAAELGGRIHLMGGWNYSNTASDSVASHSVFDLASQGWSSAAPLTVPRNAAGAAAIDGQLYVVGGRSPGIRANDQQSLGSMEVYSPATNQWQGAAPLPTPRGSLAVVALGGRLYAFGGESAPGSVSDAVERYDPVAQSWSTLPAMPYRSHGLGAVVVGDAIYVMGGFTGPSDAVGTESTALYRYQP